MSTIQFTFAQIKSGGKEILGTDFHASMLFNLLLGMFDSYYIAFILIYFILNLLGIYTTFYVGTMYLCSRTVLLSSYFPSLTDLMGASIVTRKSPRTWIIPIGITLLFIPNVISGYIRWKKINAIIGTSGNSMIKDTILELEQSTNYGVWDDVSEVMPLIVSDGLLVRAPSMNLNEADFSQIWRCFKVWNSSLRMIALSLLFFSCETGNSSLYLFIIDNLFSFSHLFNRRRVQASF